MYIKYKIQDYHIKSADWKIMRVPRQKICQNPCSLYSKSKSVGDATFRRTISRGIAAYYESGRMVTGAGKIGENVDRRTT